MNDEEVCALLKATIKYCLGQFFHYNRNAYDQFEEDFEERPPNETHLPEPALGILKELVAKRDIP